MPNTEFAEQELNASLNSHQIRKALDFLEGFSSNTLALRTLVAAMCEQDVMEQAAVLESVIEAFATRESQDV